MLRLFRASPTDKLEDRSTRFRFRMKFLADGRPSEPDDVCPKEREMVACFELTHPFGGGEPYLRYFLLQGGLRDLPLKGFYRRWNWCHPDNVWEADRFEVTSTFAHPHLVGDDHYYPRPRHIPLSRAKDFFAWLEHVNIWDWQPKEPFPPLAPERPRMSDVDPENWLVEYGRGGRHCRHEILVDGAPVASAYAFDGDGWRFPEAETTPFLKCHLHFLRHDQLLVEMTKRLLRLLATEPPLPRVAKFDDGGSTDYRVDFDRMVAIKRVRDSKTGRHLLTEEPISEFDWMRFWSLFGMFQPNDRELPGARPEQFEGIFAQPMAKLAGGLSSPSAYDYRPLMDQFPPFLDEPDAKLGGIWCAELCDGQSEVVTGGRHRDFRILRWYQRLREAFELFFDRRLNEPNHLIEGLPGHVFWRGRRPWPVAYGPKGRHQAALEREHKSQTRQWERAAATGDLEAQCELGMRALWAVGCAYDPAAARRWIGQAAAAGYPSAEYLLGRMYRHGEAFPRDAAAARKWFRAASAHGFKPADGELAQMLLEGEGGNVDEEGALNHLGLAVAKVPAPAICPAYERHVLEPLTVLTLKQQEFLNRMLRTSEKDSPRRELALEVVSRLDDFGDALAPEFFGFNRQAWALGRTDAATWWGAKYVEAKALWLALRVYYGGAKAGEAWSMYGLADTLVDLEMASDNPKLFDRFFTYDGEIIQVTSMAGGETKSFHRYGYNPSFVYRKIFGASFYPAAKEWYLRTNASGCLMGYLGLGRMAQFGLGVPADPAAAVSCYIKGLEDPMARTDTGYLRIVQWLAMAYREGLGVPVDLVAAGRYQQLADDYEADHQ